MIDIQKIKEGLAHLIANSCYEYFNERTKAENTSDYYSNFNALLEANDALQLLADEGMGFKESGDVLHFDTTDMKGIKRFNFVPLRDLLK